MFRWGRFVRFYFILNNYHIEDICSLTAKIQRVKRLYIGTLAAHDGFYLDVVLFEPFP